MNTLSRDELVACFDSKLDHPFEWRVVGWEFRLNEKSACPELLVITFTDPSGKTKKLKFTNPSFAEFGALQVPALVNVYVADLTDLGWDRSRRIEVGEWAEDQPPLFWAESVEELG